MSCDITYDDLNELFRNSSLKQYKATTDETILKTCASLLQLDYTMTEIANYNGELSVNYPSRILVPESEKSQSGRSPAVINEEQTFDAVKCRELIKAARAARCRTRFPVPVIRYRGKYLCRSATLSGAAEIYSRAGFEYVYSALCGNDDDDGGKVNDKDGGKVNDDDGVTVNDDVDDDKAAEVFEADNAAEENKSKLTDWERVNEARQSDKNLLSYMNVRTIVDLMVEDKKVKFGLKVSSSEKVDKMDRYADFNIVALPYPGCEFFKQFKANCYEGEGLHFDWEQDFVNAKIYVPDDVKPLPLLTINWTEYKSWDVILMTQNYVKLLLKCLRDHSTGTLVHCISGWDRTPLFISLVRILLWADGAAHQSLNEFQMLYFTLAYDWYSFGHNLPDRLAKGEEVLFFCFYVLKFFHNDDFRVSTNQRKPRNSASNSSSTTEEYVDFSNGEGSNGIGSPVGKAQNGNSNSNGTSHTARTSPVSVPTNGRTRQRNDSFSSINGSWHVLSGTGSIENPKESINIDDFQRIQRLTDIRTMFYKTYYATVGKEEKNFSLIKMWHDFAAATGLVQ